MCLPSMRLGDSLGLNNGRFQEQGKKFEAYKHVVDNEVL